MNFWKKIVKVRNVLNKIEVTISGGWLLLFLVFILLGIVTLIDKIF